MTDLVCNITSCNATQKEIDDNFTVTVKLPLHTYEYDVVVLRDCFDEYEVFIKGNTDVFSDCFDEFKEFVLGACLLSQGKLRTSDFTIEKESVVDFLNTHKLDCDGSLIFCRDMKWACDIFDIVRVPMMSEQAYIIKEVFEEYVYFDEDEEKWVF